MSLGLGLTVLVAIALIEGNLSRQVSQSLPEEAPGFYFIDIQPDQVEDFHALVKSFPGVSELPPVPMLRGRSDERRVGKAVSVRVDIGGRLIFKKKNQPTQ